MFVSQMESVQPQPQPMDVSGEPVGLLYPTQYHLEQKRKKELENQMMMALGVWPRMTL
jgi:hypothetical protein